MSTTSTDLAAGTAEQQTGDLAVSTAQATARHEIEGAIVIANRFPRNEDEAFGRLMHSSKRLAFASMAIYRYPRGGQQIEGPSVNLAREFARCWGNIRYGFDIVYDDDGTRTVRGWAWDVQTNTRGSQDATFAKLVYRRNGGWVKPDERDLRELTNKHGAICVRNCLVHVMPPDMTAEAMEACKATLASGIAEDVDTHRHKMVTAFRSLGVTVADLESYLDHPLPQANPEEIANLRTIYKSIADGNSTWSEYAPAKPEPATNGGATMEDIIQPSPPEPDQPAPEADPPTDEAAAVKEYEARIADATGIRVVDKLAEHAAADDRLGIHGKAGVQAACDQRRDVIRSKRGPASNSPAEQETMFSATPSATEAGQ